MVVSTIDSLLRGVMVGVASSITVGPVAVLCIQRTLSKNRRSGFVSGLGVACADTMMAIIAYFFYAMLQSQIEQYRQVLTLIGGIFVVVVGVTIFFKTLYRRFAATEQATSLHGKIFRRCSASRLPIS